VDALAFFDVIAVKDSLLATRHPAERIPATTRAGAGRSFLHLRINQKVPNNLCVF